MGPQDAAPDRCERVAGDAAAQPAREVGNCGPKMKMLRFLNREMPVEHRGVMKSTGVRVFDPARQIAVRHGSALEHCS